jgi:hypothetical protein
MACQLRCHGCDRLCNRFPDRTEELSLDYIQRFIDQAAARKQDKVGRVKVCGGEPTLHSDFQGAYEMLLQATEAGAISSLCFQSNGINKLPPVRKSPLVSWKFSGPGKKVHLPFEWAPFDLGLEVSAPCSHPRRCGYAFDSMGWILCSPGIMIARLFGFDKLYKDTMPDPGKPWGQHQLCKLCIYGAPAWFRQAWAKPLANFLEQMNRPTKSWAEALRKTGIKIDKIYNPRDPEN